jgi:hypothetical protein
MIKSLKQYITESVHLYDVTIKVAGEVDKNFLDLFIFNLKKFEPVGNITPKTLPIQKDVYGFPGMKNEPVTILKCKFRYPATEPMVQQLAQLLGYNVNYVRLVDSKYDDSINKEQEEYANQMEPNNKDFDKISGADEAAKAYSNSYLDSIKDQTKDSKVTIPYAAKETPDAFDPFKPYLDDKKLGDKSPMTIIKLPAKPKTGARG